MSENMPTPTEINLHSKSRLLVVEFSDGQRFELPCEYLRVHSPAAEVQARRVPEIGKEQVNIDRIEPQGTYAVRIIFDDGHDTGIYSWETLYDLGVNKDKYWQAYLDKLEAAGKQRNGSGEQAKRLTVLYFAYLASKMRKESEQFEVPPQVSDVQGLLQWLRRKKVDRGYLLADDNVRVTVNHQFAEPFTKLDDGDEVAIVPVSPNPPAPPKQ